MKISVIIPCFNAAKTIAVQLEALAKQTWKNWEIIVVDNGSTDESVAIVEKYQKQIPNLQLIHASDRPGAAHARNAGAKVATGEALLFCDADDRVEASWLSTMGEALLKRDFVAGCFDYTQLNEPWLVDSGILQVQKVGLSQYEFPPYLPFAGSGNLGIKKALHEAVGGFNENLLYAEDTDYCFRVQLLGTQLHFVEDAVAQIRLRHRFKDIYKQGESWAESHIYLRLLYGVSVSRIVAFGYLIKVLLYPIKIVFYLKNKSQFAKWLWILSWNIGLLKGSLKYSRNLTLESNLSRQESSQKVKTVPVN
ncbi:glycosyltransferase [Chroogloeocystis siderophila]|jgi:glycosyltransferase involved in cell wall biosynthesis|uniref:Glycosyl transferase family 2 n=1 Tax=Chroogloeocystis siderophila 5.2 s.c.1 TaxID=247279 RepID=A0A1U7HZJ1_9CHRO|nr:glycosyltransferase family 2 protein [Chroogloeocystis siderophila]OKH29085.1 glycosyl transferase family 2 [Chroogloeocystis siderophila 5.2 s.c.1]